jgi:hypothetical protein
MVYYLVSRWRDSVSILITSVSYSQDAGFYPLFCIGQATEAVTLLNCSFEVTVIPNESQILPLFQYVFFSI